MSSVIETMWMTWTKHFFHGKSCSHQSLKIHIHILRKCHHVFPLRAVWAHLWPIPWSMWSARSLLLYLCFGLRERCQRTLGCCASHSHKRTRGKYAGNKHKHQGATRTRSESWWAHVICMQTQDTLARPVKQKSKGPFCSFVLCPCQSSCELMAL